MFTYLIDLYHRAMTNQSLSTHERAMLKAVQGAVIGFVVSLLPQLLLVVAAGGHINITQTTVTTLLTAAALAVLKLWAAQNDAHLGVVLDAYSHTLTQQAMTAMKTDTPGAVQITVPSPQAVVASVVPLLEQAAIESASKVEEAPLTTPKPQFMSQPSVSTTAITAPLPAQNQPDPTFDHQAPTESIPTLTEGQK